MNGASRGRRLRRVGAALALVVALLASPAPGAPLGASGAPRAAAAAPILSKVPVVNALARLFGTTSQRTRTYKTISASRDAELAELRLREQAMRAERDRGRLPDDLYEVEAARLTALKSAVVERARREKAIAEHTYDRLVGKAAFDVVQQALLVPGGGKVGQFLTALVTGGDPAQAIARLLPSLPAAPVLDDVRRVQREWQEAKAALRFVRAPEDAVQRALRDGLDDAVARVNRELSDLAREGAAAGLDLDADQLARLEALQADVSAAHGVLAKARLQWRQARSRAEQAVVARYLKDARLLSILGRIDDLRVSRASKAVVAAYARASEDRILAALRDRGIDPASIDVDALIVEVSLAVARTRAAALEAGDDPWALDVDAVIGRDVDAFLATAGVEPATSAGSRPTTTGGAATTAVTLTGRFTNLAPSPFEKNEVRLRLDPRGGAVSGTAAIVLAVALPGCSDRFNVDKDAFPTLVPPPVTLRESWTFTLRGTLDATGAMKGSAVLGWSMSPETCNGRVQYKAAGYTLSWTAQRDASGVVRGKLIDQPHAQGCKLVQDAYVIQPRFADGSLAQRASQPASCLGSQTFDPTGPSFELRP